MTGPCIKAAVAGEEHELGIWLHSQRQKARRGELDEARARALDEAVPGWRKGRQRGRKPRNDTCHTGPTAASHVKATPGLGALIL